MLLQYNGGTTSTIRLRATSPAVNQGDTAACPATDQRGIARVGVCDIGATEKLPPRKIPAGPDTIGEFVGGNFYLQNHNGPGVPEYQFTFNPYGVPQPYLYAVTGDWNGDGIDTVGIYDTRVGVFLLTDSNTAPTGDYAFVYGNPGDVPIAGCWDESMLITAAGSNQYRCTDGVGVYRPSGGMGFFLHHGVGTGQGFADYYTSTVVFANPGTDYIPLAGDWDGDGFDSIGLFRKANSVFSLTNTILADSFPTPDYTFAYGGANSLPLAGDWVGGNGGNILHEGIGVTTNGNIYLRNTLTGGYPDIQFAWGGVGWTPLAGKWNARGNGGMAVSAPNIIVPRGTPQPPVVAPTHAPTPSDNGGQFD